jgi:hypothetical protein
MSPLSNISPEALSRALNFTLGIVFFFAFWLGVLAGLVLALILNF